MRIRAQFSWPETADQFVGGEEARVERHVAAITGCAAECGPKSPSICWREERIAEDAAVLSGGANQVYAAAKPASGSERFSFSNSASGGWLGANQVYAAA